MYPGRQNSPRSPPAKDVSVSVKSLLLATKNLQDRLQSWSLGNSTEDEVSDCYVSIGNEFNAMITAFGQFDIDLSEVYSVPKDLRDVLENCLGEAPSPKVLAQYLPEVRRIIYNLLQGLQSKQDAYYLATTGRSTPPYHQDRR